MDKIKPWEELTLADDFMFCKIMTDESLCRKMLEILLGIKIDRLVYHSKQETVEPAYDAKGIRLDVYVEDSTRIFDVEIQTTVKKDLAKRARYYQSLIDVDALDKGDVYTDLKESYIIFICTEDPFKLGLSRYTFLSTCKEKADLTLNDKAIKVFYNVRGFEQEENPEIKAFLELVGGGKPKSIFTEQLQAQVDTAKNKAESWRKEYMTFEMLKRELRKDGMSEGIAIGERRGEERGIAIGERRGEERGLSQGAYNTKIETARAMKELNYSVEEISRITKLSENEIDSL